MAKTDNLSDFLTDVANSIRTKTGTTEQINAQDFSDKILGISGLKKLIAGKTSCTSLFSTYDGTSVDDLIQYSDTENIIDMTDMFYGCDNLTTVPLLNTSNVVHMRGMFKECRALTTIPLFDTSKVNYMSEMFWSCSNLTSIPLLNTSNVTYMDFMFCSCHGLTTIPLFDTSKVTRMDDMFNYCIYLTTVPALDVSNVTNMHNMFVGCSSLKSILMTNIGADLDISASIRFERSDLLVILNNLKTVGLSKTLKMGADNLAKLTDEDKAIAINKGWTLA